MPSRAVPAAAAFHVAAAQFRDFGKWKDTRRRRCSSSRARRRASARGALGVSAGELTRLQRLAPTPRAAAGDLPIGRGSGEVHKRKWPPEGGHS